MDLLSLERYELKNRSGWFVDEVDSQKVKLHWGDDYIKFKWILSRDLCENYIAHCLFCLNLFRFRVSACFADGKAVINQRRVEKSAFENQSEEILVWMLKWTTLLGIFWEYKFYACCHILLSSTHPKRRCTSICGAAWLLYRCNWCRNHAVVNCIHCIVLTLSTHCRRALHS